MRASCPDHFSLVLNSLGSIFWRLQIKKSLITGFLQLYIVSPPWFKQYLPYNFHAGATLESFNQVFKMEYVIDSMYLSTSEQHMHGPKST
jgi:hypothetical protein